MIETEQNPIIAEAIGTWNEKFPEHEIRFAWGVPDALHVAGNGNLAEVAGALITLHGEDFELYAGAPSGADDIREFDGRTFMLRYAIKPGLPLRSNRQWKYAALLTQLNIDAAPLICDGAIVGLRSPCLPLAACSWHKLGNMLDDLLRAREWLFEKWGRAT